MHRQKLSAAFVAVLGAILLLSGCDRLALEKSISMESVYPNPNQTNVTVYYTVPYPPPGKVYVLWIVNPTQHEAVATGQVPGGRNQSAKASVRFAATGAVVSIENNATPTKMSSTWALRVGTVMLETPTPGGPPTATGGASTPMVTPSGQTTPSAATTTTAETPSAATATPDQSTPSAATTPSGQTTPSAATNASDQMTPSAATTTTAETPSAATPDASAPIATP